MTIDSSAAACIVSSASGLHRRSDGASWPGAVVLELVQYCPQLRTLYHRGTLSYPCRRASARRGLRSDVHQLFEEHKAPDTKDILRWRLVLNYLKANEGGSS